MPNDFYLICAGILLAAGGVVCFVWLLERWLLNLDKPKIRRPLRVRKVKKKPYEPPVPRRYRVYPDGREEAIPGKG